MLNTNTVNKLQLFEEYRDKGLILLKVMHEISQDPIIDHRLGDFSYKHLVLKH